MIAALVAFALPTCLVTVGEPRDFPQAGSATWLYENVRTPLTVDEAILSWNVKDGENASLFVEVRARDAEGESAWLPLARWTLDERRAERTSLPQPVDELAQIETDTIVLKRPLREFDLRLTAAKLGPGPTPRLTHLALAGSLGKPTTSPSAAFAAIVPLPVPERAQGDYPNGGVLCSPTSLSMVLNHWGRVASREDLAMDMPAVQQSVFDPEYAGTGNWAFNAAYAGSRPGMRGVVARLARSEDLRPWLRLGVPVVLSVSLDLLKGKPKDSGSGHLVVLCGFDANGDPIMNDPAWRGAVRRTYKREDFERAWAYSRHTVYLAYPESLAVPSIVD